MMISVKKVFISSNSRIICLPCPLPRGRFLIQESAVGGLSYYKKKQNILFCLNRRGWDSNPRALSDKRFSRPPRYDRFDTPPYMKVLLCSTYDIISYSKRFVKCFCEKSRSFASSFFRHRKSIESLALLCYTEEKSFSR